MIFTYDTDTLTFTVPPQYPYGGSIQKTQTMEKSASGVVHVEDYGVDTGKITVVFFDMPKADLVDLLDWFENIVNGMYTVFEVDDEIDDPFDAYFFSPIIEYEQTSHGLYETTFVLGLD